MNTSPFVSIIIVTYNGRRHLERLIPSLTQLHYPADCLELIIMDNGSSDGTPAWLAAHAPHARLVPHAPNHFAAAVNAGIRQAQGQCVAVLNDDCWVHLDWLDALMTAIQRDPKIGAVGGKILFDERTISSVGLHEISNHYWTDRGSYEPDTGQYDREEAVPALSACALLWRRACLEDVGLFDEAFEIYYEDVDWCLRARQKGWRLCYTPTAVAWHRLHGTMTREQATAYTERNRLLLLAKHTPQGLAAAFESTDWFVQQPSLEPLWDALQRVRATLITCHGTTMAAPIMANIVEKLPKLLRRYTTASVLSLQEQLDGLRRQLDTARGEARELSVMKQALDRALQILAEERDLQQTKLVQAQQSHEALIAEFQQSQARLQQGQAQLEDELQRLYQSWWYRAWAYCVRLKRWLLQPWIKERATYSNAPRPMSNIRQQQEGLNDAHRNNREARELVNARVRKLVGPRDGGPEPAAGVRVAPHRRDGNAVPAPAGQHGADPV